MANQSRAKLKIKFIKKIKLLLKSDALWEKMGRKAVRRIKDVTRSGDNINTGRPLKGISDKWADRKEQLTELNKTSKFYVPALSNLTFTGKLLNSLKFRVKKGLLGGRKVIVEATGIHKPYKTVSGKKRGKVSLNSDIVKGQADQGRKFIGMDKEGTKQLKAIAVRMIRKEVRRLSGK